MWGYNIYGQVGIGSTEDQTIPVKVLENVRLPIANAGDEGNPFADVDPTGWQFEPAKFVYKRGLMTGKGKDEAGKIIFDPNATLTRAEFAQSLYSAEGKPSMEYTSLFQDVAAGQWFTNAVLWAGSNKLVSGYPNGNYGVSDNITREQLAAILYKYAEYKKYDISARAEIDGYTDADLISSWAKEQLRWAVANGIMKGKDDRLDPQGNATRAECAAMLRSFFTRFGE